MRTPQGQMSCLAPFGLSAFDMSSQTNHHTNLAFLSVGEVEI